MNQRKVEIIVKCIYSSIGLVLSLRLFAYEYIPLSIQNIMSVMTFVLIFALIVIEFSKNKFDIGRHGVKPTIKEIRLDKAVKLSDNTLLKMSYHIHSLVGNIFVWYLVCLVLAVEFAKFEPGIVSLMIYVLLLGIYLGSLFNGISKDYLANHVHLNDLKREDMRQIQMDNITGKRIQ